MDIEQLISIFVNNGAMIACLIYFMFSAKKETEKTTQAIENRQEIIAAVSAVIAEELGTDVSAIRVLSFKKL